MSSSRYYAPTQLNEAVQQLAQQGARAMAGGTDLLVQMRSRLEKPAAIVDLKKIDSLRVLPEHSTSGRI